MLIELKVTNYRSIREEQTFSLVAGNADKELASCVIDRELPGLSGVRFLKGAAIYGANASGKSNVIEAIRFVTSFVQRSATKIQPGDPTGAEPLKLDRDSASKPSEFEITFVAENDRFVFGFSVTPTRVMEEYLVAYPKGAPQRWYHRTFNAEKNVYEWEKPSTAFKQDKSLQDKTRDISLFLSVGPQFNHAQLTQVFNWFKNSVRFIHLSADAMLHPGFTAELVAKPTHHDRIMNLLRSADIGVADAQIQEKEISMEELKQSVPPSILARLEKDGPIQAGKSVEISLTHKAEGMEPVALDFNNEESAGTRRFFSLIGPWTDILDNGHTVFVDEIETSLHPVLVKELLKLLLCSKNNPKGAQVVFTTHNPILLDGTLMRRDQVWFTEKSGLRYFGWVEKTAASARLPIDRPSRDRAGDFCLRPLRTYYGGFWLLLEGILFPSKAHSDLLRGSLKGTGCGGHGAERRSHTHLKQRSAEKSPVGATHLYPLTDYQPRKDEALAKGYLAGRYGAIPFMPEGLKL